MVEELSPSAVREKIERDEPFDLIDVRDDEAYADGHLPEAEHVTIDELEDTVVDRDWADEVVLYCYIGETSVQAARLVEEYGDAESVGSMAGGYDAWEPLETRAD
ncbi:rhodanese-like domain-containing protein [Haloarcula nitratireducens]|uniref:Rhodanese-like domain-containing protein n=1 Tax=Haloarcula nitratireducens TaxID=2487749 RepID=A0AAW4PIN6_9EURY|nr:rhodanese-like domain-containing protein [Halomicroarcula nitratireducens]MBX0297788.1 rhodanese-like domain-containing protein [Halomicroarcula nitratireducens]